MHRPQRRMLIGPAGGPLVVGEALVFTDPVNPDQPDNPVTLGVQFAVTVAGMWNGMRIRIPDTAPGVATEVLAYNEDTNTLLTSDPFTAVPGGYQDIAFTTPQAVGPGVNYLAAWFTNRYAFTAAYPWPASSASGQLVTASGTVARFTFNATPTQPVTQSAVNFYVSPIVEF